VRNQLALHVDPRGVRAFGQGARVVVQDFVQHAEAQVAHADVVDIGERQTHARVYRLPVLPARAVFGAGVARRFFDALQEVRIGMFEELHGWGPGAAPSRTRALL